MEARFVSRSATPLLLILILAGCAPQDFRSVREWEIACAKQGGEPMEVRNSQGLRWVCFRSDAILKVKP